MRQGRVQVCLIWASQPDNAGSHAGRKAAFRSFARRPDDIAALTWPVPAVYPGCLRWVLLYSWIAHIFPSGSLKKQDREPGVPSGSSCCTLLMPAPGRPVWLLIGANLSPKVAARLCDQGPRPFT